LKQTFNAPPQRFIAIASRFGCGQRLGTQPPAMTPSPYGIAVDTELHSDRLVA